MGAAKKAPYTRSGKEEMLGLREEKCAACGAMFERHAEHAWKLYFGRKQRWYCSYTCMRKDERPRIEAARVIAEGKPAEKRRKTDIERAQEKVERCRARYQQAQARKLDGKAWDAMTQRERRNANKAAYNWLARLIMAETELEDARKRGGKEQR